ncbi:tetratricopeptide repeat protein [Paenibacillus validus]|uniref:tetratricopeptide repeat protein n=1 Tax=Paenibacillus validus TaxID=44253 RepID=UPI000FDCDCF7|nr:tetratricopeptide repeat protein [Paenibacillus validus]MED4600248.1 tetratricopeptide repeat protein [Paenibacillus validus]MED4605249.1 tetratricopeptide repeat protein [Paenibacillus validus]
MAFNPDELHKIKSYSRDQHVSVIYEYIVGNKSQEKVSALTGIEEWTVSSIIRAYNFNQNKNGSFRSGTDRGKYRGTERELVSKFVNLHYPGNVEARTTFADFIAKHKKQVAKPPAAPPRQTYVQRPVQQSPVQRSKPPVPKPAPAPRPVVYQPTASELYNKAIGLWNARNHNRDMVDGFRQAAELGHEDAPYYLAVYYRDRGHYGAENLQAAQGWFAKALERGCRQAKLEYGDFYYELALNAKALKLYNTVVPSYEKAAKAGHSGAQNNLGVLYANGEGVTRNDQLAVYWFDLAAKNGNRFGMSNLAYRWMNGSGVQQNDVQALYWFEKAAGLGDEDAKKQCADIAFKLGRRLGKSTDEQDRKQAFDYYQKALLYGNQEALFYLAHSYANGLGVNQSYRQAAEYYEKAAQRGSAAAQNNLAVLYANGHGVTQDHGQALYWYEQAANNGSKVAMRNMGYCYKEGRGCPKNAYGAVHWFEKAAELGDEEARSQCAEGAYWIAEQFYKSRDVQEKGKAFEYFAKALKHGHDKSLLNLAVCCEYGHGVEQSYAKAIEYYQQALSKGIDKAYEWLADAYYQYGKEYDEEESYDEAIAMFEKAAEMDHEDAMIALAQCYFEGKGVNMDDHAAAEWYVKAAEVWSARTSAEEHYMEAAEKCFNHYEIERGLAWYERAADLGAGKAMVALGNYYFGEEDYNDDPEYETAIEWYLRALEQGDDDGEYHLYRCYIKLGEQAWENRNIEQAIAMYKEARKYGYGDSTKESLHRCYCHLARAAVDAEDYRLAAEHYEQAEEHERLGEEEDAYIEKIGDHFYDSEDYYGAWNWYKKSGNLARQTGRAQNAIGLSYIRKNGKQPDFVQAFYWCKQAAEQGFSPAQYNVGGFYLNGDGVQRDFTNAVYWYEQAAKNRHKNSLHNLAFLYMSGMGVPQDLDQAEELLTAAYLQGFDNRTYRFTCKPLSPLRSLLARTASVKPSPLESMRTLYALKYPNEDGQRLLKFADFLVKERQCFELIYEIGLSYETGYSPLLGVRVESDMAKAFVYYKEAVDKAGDVRAIGKLGHCYRHGKGIGQSDERAIEAYKRGEALKDPESLNALGECYFTGQGVGQDYSKTFEYCSYAAEQGHAEAQYNVGFCYENGYGVERNERAALEWYVKSAEQGFALAEQQVAVCYELGIGVEPSPEKAREWLAKAGAKSSNAILQQYHPD